VRAPALSFGEGGERRAVGPPHVERKEKGESNGEMSRVRLIPLFAPGKKRKESRIQFSFDLVVARGGEKKSSGKRQSALLPLQKEESRRVPLPRSIRKKKNVEKRTSRSPTYPSCYKEGKRGKIESVMFLLSRMATRRGKSRGKRAEQPHFRPICFLQRGRGGEEKSRSYGLTEEGKNKFKK